MGRKSKSSENLVILTLKEKFGKQDDYPVDIADAETVDNTYSEMCNAILHPLRLPENLSISSFFCLFLHYVLILESKRLLHPQACKS